jgi:hypothetical protein
LGAKLLFNGKILKEKKFSHPIEREAINPIACASYSERWTTSCKIVKNGCKM